LYVPGDPIEVLKPMTALERLRGRYDPMLTVVRGDGSGHQGGKKGGWPSLIDEIVRKGARTEGRRTQ
jgi:hypothetical protein